MEHTEKPVDTESPPTLTENDLEIINFIITADLFSATHEITIE